MSFSKDGAWAGGPSFGFVGPAPEAARGPAQASARARKRGQTGECLCDIATDSACARGAGTLFVGAGGPTGFATHCQAAPDLGRFALGMVRPRPEKPNCVAKP